MKYDYDDDYEFMKKINEYVKSYHKHTMVKDKTIIKKQKKDKGNEQYTKNRRMPDFLFENKIGTIIFYAYNKIYDPDDAKAHMAKFTDLVKSKLKTWEEHNMIGLILDFRQHRGGNIFPLYHAFSDFFNNSTIFGWKSEKAKKTDEIWMNFRNGDLEQGKFIDDIINFEHPIAIIIGEKTRSTGELGALMFYGRDNVNFFGKPTSGYASANRTFVEDDFILILTTNLVNTVDGTLHHKEQLYPDKDTDDPIFEAIKWIVN